MRIPQNLAILMAVASLYPLPSFTSDPAYDFDPGSGIAIVSFALSESTDVEVSIVQPRDSSVVRHLAAGLLGANAPAPLASGTLAQTIPWDGRDDFNRPVADPESLTVRVRAGMRPELRGFAAEDLFYFDRVGGMVRDRDGSILILYKQGQSSFLRRYDLGLNYVQTLFPPPADLPAASVTAYGIHETPSSEWNPVTYMTGGAYLLLPTLTNSFINHATCRLLPPDSAGNIPILGQASANDKNLLIQSVSENGAFSGAVAPLIASPAMDTGRYFGIMGPKYYTPAHDPKFLYVSGFYYAEGNTNNFMLVQAPNTGFWADGQVFKVNRETGTAVSWLKLDSVPVLEADRSARLDGQNGVAAIHGVAVDDSGHVFVCDRMHQCIGVYDTNAVLLGTLPCADMPDQVAVSTRTGAIYVVADSRATHPSEFILHKYADWRNPGAPTASIVLWSNYSVDPMAALPTFMLVFETSGATTLMVSNRLSGTALYSDNGSSLVKSRSLTPSPVPASMTFFERMTVDRRTDDLYWVNTPGTLYSITDWANPVPACRNRHAGGMSEDNFVADEICFAPNGNVFFQNVGNVEDWNWKVAVKRLDRELAPLDYLNTPGSNAVTQPIYFEGAVSKCNHRGLAAGWQDQIAVFDETHNLFVYPDTGYADTSFKGTLVAYTNKGGYAGRDQFAGVKFDPAGNIYLGIYYQGPDWQTDPLFADDDAFKWCGSVARIRAGQAEVLNLLGTGLTGADKVYPQPLGPFSLHNCSCRNPGYFDVDPYGRLFIPCSPTGKVAVVDNSGNTIASLGEYGNTDTRAGIPIAWPMAVAASEDYLYVGDNSNARILRIAYNYALDNMPGLTDNAADRKSSAMPAEAMALSPNPFNPTALVRVTLRTPTRIELRLYDCAGRSAAVLAEGYYGAGTHTFKWNALNGERRPPSGVYYCRLIAGKQVLIKTAVLAK